MNNFMNNRYARLAALTIGLAVIFYLLTWFFFYALGATFPLGLHIVVSLLASGFVVAKYLAFRVG